MELSRALPQADILGITIKAQGLGDGLQFSSLPENYFRATGKKLLDLTRPWFFDHNPYVEREKISGPFRPIELWNFSPKQWNWPSVPEGRKPGVYLSNAEIWARLFGVPAKLTRPRLYFCEDFPFEKRERILFHTHGRSHGVLSDAVIDHVVRKYGPGKNLWHLGLEGDPDYGLPKIRVRTFWELAHEISSARMFIGPDSGPSWIAAAYPDIITKVVRMRPSDDILKNWVPLERDNIHSHWDDRCRGVYNPTTEDIGFTWSYRRL